MVGMGKAMSHWLDTLRQSGAGSSEAGAAAEAWAGLERIRDGLLDAGIRDVDDFVNDWAWNNGLDASRSSQASTPSEASHPGNGLLPHSPLPLDVSGLPLASSLSSPVPSLTVPLPVAVFSDPATPTLNLDPPEENTEATPKIRQGPPPALWSTEPDTVGGPSLRSPIAPAAPPVSGALAAPAAGPPIFLSTRTDRPSPTLSRTTNFGHPSSYPSPIAAQQQAAAAGSPRGQAPVSPATSPRTQKTPITSPPVALPPSQSSSRSPLSPLSPLSHTRQALRGPLPPDSNGDPLAGIGVGVVKAADHRRRSSYLTSGVWSPTAPVGAGLGASSSASPGTGTARVGSPAAKRSGSRERATVDPLGAGW